MNVVIKINLSTLAYISANMFCLINFINKKADKNEFIRSSGCTKVVKTLTK